MPNPNSKDEIKSLMKRVWGIDLDDEEVRALQMHTSAKARKGEAPRMDRNKLPCKRHFSGPRRFPVKR